MNDFEPLKGRVLLSSSGVYKQADLYLYKGQIYAKHGQDYIELRAGGRTSKDKVFYKDLELLGGYHFNIGKMMFGHQSWNTSKTAAE